MSDDSSTEIDADVSDTEFSELNEGADGGNPEYETDETRRLSFPDNWQYYHTQTPEDMSAAGFFHEKNYDDTVCCYKCGVRVRNWNPGDIPLEWHIKANKRCPFARQALGDAEVERIFKSMAYEGAHEAKSQLNEVGYTDDAISKALEQVTNTGSDTPNHMDFTNAAEDLRKSIRDESDTTVNILICLRCSVDKRSVMFLPCGCTASCESCAMRAEVCFLCKRHVSERMKVYFG